MSKTSSTDLFILIKSLTKNEKGYIKKLSFQKKSENPNFIRLFNAIDNQKEYNEKELLKSEDYIVQLPRLKNYLYDHILDCLISYQTKNNIDIQLRKAIGQIQILFEKGLYEQCLKQFTRAKETARESDRFAYLLEILDWERLLVIEKMMVADFDSISLEEKKVGDQLLNLSFYKNAYQEISKIYTEVIYVRTMEQQERFLSILRHENFSDESKAISLTAKIFYYKSVCKYYSAIDDRDKYVEGAQMAVQLIENNPKYLEQNLLQYVKLVNNLLATLSEHSMNSSYENYYNKLKNLPVKYPQAKTEKMVDLLNKRIMIRDYFHSFNNNLFFESLSAAQKIEESIKDRNELIADSHQLMFLYHVAYTYFVNGSFKKALKSVNKIISASISPDKLFFICQARILGMFIQIELDNLDLLNSQLKSNERFFKKLNISYKLEPILFKFTFDYLNCAAENRQRHILYHQLISHIERSLPELEKKMFDYFDCIAWAKSRLSNKLMKDLLPKKAK